MAEASLAVIGVALPTVNKFIGLDEGKLEGFRSTTILPWRQTARCEGYLERMGAH